MPTWPGAAERRQPAAPRQVNAAVLGASLGANVALLLALLGLLLLGHPGVSLPGGSTAGSPPGSATRAGLSSPTATSSPSPLAGGLQVAPGQVQLGCDNGQQTQFAVLANIGPDDVHWQAVFSPSAAQAGIAVSPYRGNLRAGTSVVLQIQNRARDGGQQGVIRFDAGASDADSPASLSYTTQGCG